MRIRTWLVVALAGVLVVGGCGVGVAWYGGAFVSAGRFPRGLDACTLLPPATSLAPLVADGAREPGASKPKTLIGTTDGDTASDCKWSSVPAGRDRPFRTVRIATSATVKDGDASAETRAARAFATSRDETARDEHIWPVPLGSGAYGHTDVSQTGFILASTDVYDVHVLFRVSNAIIDVSGRTHARVTARHRRLILGLAETIAARLRR